MTIETTIPTETPIDAPPARRLPWLMFATPAIGTVSDETDAALHSAWIALEREGHRREIDWTYWKEPSLGLVLARNLIAARFLAVAPDDDAKLLMIDSDVHGFTPEDVLRIARAPEDMIGAPVPGRTIEPRRIQHALAEGVALEDLHRHMSPLLCAVPLESARFQGNLIACHWTGTGFLAVTKRALLAMMPHARRGLRHRAPDGTGEVTYTGFFTPLELPDQGQIAAARAGGATDARIREMVVAGDIVSDVAGEDVSFCMRHQYAGGTVWLDIDTRLQHVGRASYMAPDLRSIVRPPFPVRAFDCIARPESPVDLHCPEGCESSAQGVMWGEYDLPLTFETPPTVLDLGANVGAFTAFAGVKWPGARVHAYEPHPKMFVALSLNTRGMRGAIIQPLAVVAANAAGGALLYCKRRNPCCAGIDRMEGETEADAVRVSAIDAYALPDAEVLKLDMEGNEAAVLARYLARPRPRLVGIALEHHSEADRDELVARVLPRAGFVVVSERLGHGRVILATRPPASAS